MKMQIICFRGGKSRFGVKTGRETTKKQSGNSVKTGKNNRRKIALF